jgi:hypothetical protein
MEEKLNLKFNKLPMCIKALRNIFFNLVDEKAMELIALKVSKMNGDVRVAFDLMKTSLARVKQMVDESSPMLADDKIKVTCNIVCEVCQDKYGSKIYETL